jgi:putative phage-type endonuclease
MSDAAWHAARAKVVGASEVAALFGVSPHTSHYALWHIKAGRVPPPNLDEDERVRWGRRLEAPIAAGIAEDQGWTIAKGGHITHPTEPGMGCTLDYRITQGGPMPGEGVLEVKAVDWLVRKREWGEEPPAHILLQLQHQLACTGLAWGVVGALVGGNDVRIWPYTARPAVMKEIARRVGRFWASIRANKPPAPDGSESTSATLAALHPHARGERLDLRGDNELPEACAGFIRASEERAAAERARDACAAIIRAKLGKAPEAMVAGYTVRLPEVTGTPDRIISQADVGRVIKGRAGHRRLAVKPYELTEEAAA